MYIFRARSTQNIEFFYVFLDSKRVWLKAELKNLFYKIKRAVRIA